jgi:DNA-binding NarL/FixJ family response regulator
MTGRTFTEEERKQGGNTSKSLPSFSRYGFNEKAVRKKRNGLTKREKEILLLASKTNKEISQRLFITEKTVINHFTHILNKLGCDNRTEAILYAETHHLFEKGIPVGHIVFTADMCLPI